MAKRSTLLVLALYVAVAVVLLAGAFRRFDHLGGKDWNAFLGQAQAETTTLLDFGQFPAWNPWRRGGQVSFAQPESMLLSPVTPLALVVGANAAFKLLLLPLFVVAAMGMWALAGSFGLTGVARALPGAVFIGASVFPLYVNGGLPNWLCGMAILPWLVTASRRAVGSRGARVGGAALLAGLLCCGNVHHFVFFPLLLALEAAARSVQTRSARPLLATAAIGIGGTALSLVRLVPLLELFSEFPRRLVATGRFLPLSFVPRSLLWPHPADLDAANHGVVMTGGSALYWVDCGAYVGPLVAALALVAAVLAWRRSWPALLLGGAFLWLALGSGVRLSAWDLLRRLPVYRSMQAPERFMGFVLFALALLAGFGAAAIEAWLARRGAAAARWFRILVPVAVIAPLLVVNAPITREAFPVPPPGGVAPSTLLARAPPPPPFEQRRFPSIPQQWGGPLHEPVLRNAGNVDGFSDVPSQDAAIAAGEPGYRGELFLAGGHGEASGAITPNRITAHVRLDAPDLLVVNQNFFPGWRRAEDGERCVAHEDRIALPLPKGEHDVTLDFSPRTIPAGALLTLLALVAIALGERARRRAATPSAATRAEVLEGIAQAVLFAGVVGWYATREPSAAGAPPPPWRERAIAVAAGEPGALQRALDAAPPGAIVRLLPGDHGAATLRRGVTLVGDPPGAARVEGLTIAGVAAEQRAVALGFELAGVDGSPALSVERCAGVVEISVSARPGCVLSVESSPQLFLFGEGPPLRITGATLRESRVAFARCEFGAAGGGRAAIDAEASVLLLDACAFAESKSPPLALRRGSLARASRTACSGADVDATSSFAALDGRFPSLQVRRAGLRTDPAATLLLTGPPGARGTLVVSKRPAFVPYRGAVGGQFLLGKLAADTSLLVFELDAKGELELGCPHPPASWLPGDGFYLQAFLAGPDGEPESRLFSLLDGGPTIPE